MVDENNAYETFFFFFGRTSSPCTSFKAMNVGNFVSCQSSWSRAHSFCGWQEQKKAISRMTSIS
jgi:hypothetical protein